MVSPWPYGAIDYNFVEFVQERSVILSRFQKLFSIIPLNKGIHFSCGKTLELTIGFTMKTSMSPPVAAHREVVFLQSQGRIER